MWKSGANGGRFMGRPRAGPALPDRPESDRARRWLPGEDYRAYFRVRLEAPQGQRIRVAVSGEVDLVVAEALRGVIIEALGRDGVRVVEVDLRATTFLDACGLRVLLATRQLARTKGQVLYACGAVGIVREVFAIAGLLGLLHDEEPNT